MQIVILVNYELTSDNVNRKYATPIERPNGISKMSPPLNDREQRYQSTKAMDYTKYYWNPFCI